tara:strand:+ start:1060 stop:1404 length:345 start_codon:yes stop_codon:yes gene_type:complete
MLTALFPVFFTSFVFVSFVFSDVLAQQDDFLPSLAHDFFWPLFEQESFFAESDFPSQQVFVFLLTHESLHVLPVFAQTFSVFTTSFEDGTSDCAEIVHVKNANAASKSKFLILN